MLSCFTREILYLKVGLDLVIVFIKMEQNSFTIFIQSPFLTSQTIFWSQLSLHPPLAIFLAFFRQLTFESLLKHCLHKLQLKHFLFI